MRTNPTPKHPGGRPTKFRPDICESVVKLMAEGRSLDGCATLLGVHPDSLYEWQRVHAEFSGAVRAGRAAATTVAIRPGPQVSRLRFIGLTALVNAVQAA